MVINFEELDAMLLAADLDPGLIEVDVNSIEASSDAWGFASTGGVMAAVKNQLPEGIDLRPMCLMDLIKSRLSN